MMVDCPRHSLQFGVLTSPDLSSLINARLPIPDTRELAYEYRGELTNRMILTLAFGEANSVPEKDRIPLPDDYPSWFAELLPTCEKCLEEVQRL